MFQPMCEIGDALALFVRIILQVMQVSIIPHFYKDYKVYMKSNYEKRRLC